MVSNLNAQEKNLDKIFSSDFEYHMPAYQRPYAWGKEQAAALLEDLTLAFQEKRKEDYFLGSIVIIKERDSDRLSNVIDGQQRLTTLTILLAVIRDKLASDNDMYRGVDVYINEEGNKARKVEPKPRLFLREKDQAFFRKYIQEGRHIDELLALESDNFDDEAQKLIFTNTEYFYKKISESFPDESQETLREFFNFVMEKCFLVLVSAPTEDSAFRVFSVLNTRGLDLQLTDILKADIIGAISESDQDEYTRKWEDIEVSLGRVEFNNLFSYVRMIYQKERAERSIREELKDIFRKEKAKKVVDNLAGYAQVLKNITENSYGSADEEVRAKIISYFTILNRIDNRDWVPPTIAYLSKYRGKTEDILWFLTKIERLAAFFHVTSTYRERRIARYGLILKDIESLGEELRSLKSIELSTDEKHKFIEILDGDVYQLTVARCSYIILRLDESLSDGGARYIRDQLTIEHILPQNPRKDSKWDDTWPLKEQKKWLHKIGNLIPLTRIKNSKANNKDFAEKKVSYYKAADGILSYNLANEVLHENAEWLPSNAERRQKRLLAQMKKVWDLN